MPLRSEIDPRGLKGALEYCFVLERIAPGLARLRVAGSHLGDLMGMEVRGMPITAFYDENGRLIRTTGFLDRASLRQFINNDFGLR